MTRRNTDLNHIAQLAAQIYAGQDWHALSKDEKELVELLENNSYLIPNQPANGFVGKMPVRKT